MRKSRLLLLTTAILFIGSLPKAAFSQAFSADAVWGEKSSYTELEAANWSVLTIDGNDVYAINTSSINPIHTSGDPWFDPDGAEEAYGNGAGSGLGELAYVGTQSLSDFKITLSIARPGFDAANGNWDAGIIWGLVDGMNYNYVNFGTSPKPTCAAFVDGEGLRGGPLGLNFAVNMNVSKFQDTALHVVSLEKVGNQVILKYEGTPFLSIEDDAINDAGYVGFGSWNDGGYFDDITVETITAFSGSTDASLTTTVGTVAETTISGITEGTTVQELLDALTLASGASAIVVNPDENGVYLQAAGTEVVANTMQLLVTSEAGFMVSYTLETLSLSDDISIAAYFSPLEYDTVSGVISTIEGTTLELFLGKIRPQETATEAVFDGSTEVTDPAAIIMDGMVYRVTAEDQVTTHDYPIATYEPPYPTLSAIKVSDANPVYIDAFFDEWVGFDNAVAIVDYNAESETLVAPDNDADLSASMKLAWDDNFLYMYFRVQDQTTVTDAENSWENDGIEIALVMTDDLGKRSGYNMFWKPEEQPGNEKLMYIEGSTMAQTVSNGLNTGATIRDYTGASLERWELEDGNTGYELEMALPWTALNGINNPDAFVPALGNLFSANIAVSDNDGSGRESILFIVNANMNQDASNYPLVRLDGATAVKADKSEQLSLYPNPAESFLKVGSIQNARTVEISNIAGQLVKKLDISATGEMSLNVSNLKTGVYLITVSDANGNNFRGKFIKK